VTVTFEIDHPAYYHDGTRIREYKWISNRDVTTALWYTPVNPSTLWTAATKDTWISSWNVPVLDSNWHLANSVIPWVALTDTFTVSTSSDLTTLSSADQWDIAIVSSENKTYVLSQAPYSTASNWKQILSPTGWVTSVNGQTWAVTLSIPTDTSDLTNWAGYLTSSTWVTTFNWNSWAITVNAYAPWNTWSTWQVLTKTADGYEYQNAPVTSVNGSTWAVTGLQTTSNLKKSLSDNSDSYYPSQKAVKTAVDAKQATLVSWTNIKTINWNSILGSWNLTVSWLPSGWTEWQILMIVGWTPTWVTPTAKWFKMLSPNSPLNVPYDWYGTEAQYNSATKSNDTEYRTY
jgi:hypothetical protein